MELAGVPWQQLGLAGMAIFAVALVLTGRLVPRSTLTDAFKARDEWAAHARDSEKSRQVALEELSSMNRSLHALATQKELSVAMLQSVRARSEQEEST